MARVTLTFHGYLKDLVSDTVEVYASTVKEAIELVTEQVAALAPNPITGSHRVSVLDHDTIESLYKQIDSDTYDVHILPQLAGGKGLWQIIVGVVLIGASILVPGLGALGGILLSTGISLLAGGLLQLLYPQPKNDITNGDGNRYLGVPKNTVAIGTPIPILYGRHKVYGHVLSSDNQAFGGISAV